MLRQASTYLAAHAVSALFGFASIAVFTHLLSPAEYGLYVVTMGLAGVISAVLFSWIRLSIVRFNQGTRESDMRGTALVCYLALMLASPVVAAIVAWVSGIPLWQGAFAVLVAFCLGFFEFGQDIFRSRQTPGAYAGALIVRAATSFAFSMALVLAGYEGEGMLIGICLGYGLAALLYAPKVWRMPLRGFDRDILRKLARFGIPMTLSGSVFALHALFDRLIILAYLGEAGAGAYGAAADLVRQIILFPAVAIGSAIIPVAARLLAESGPEATHRHLERSAELLVAVLLPAVVGLALVSGPLSDLMLGPEFREAGKELIPILAFSWLFQAFTQQYIHASFHLGQKPVLMLVQALAMLAVNAAAMFALVPRYGLQGAAWALVVAELFGMVIGYALSFRAQRLFFKVSDFMRSGAATAVMALSTTICLHLGPEGSFLTLIVSVLVGIASYAGSALLLNVLSLRGEALDFLQRLKERLA